MSICADELGAIKTRADTDGPDDDGCQLAPHPPSPHHAKHLVHTCDTELLVIARKRERDELHDPLHRGLALLYDEHEIHALLELLGELLSADLALELPELLEGMLHVAVRPLGLLEQRGHGAGGLAWGLGSGSGGRSL